MFDDPGKKLRQLEEELLEVEDTETENLEDTACDGEEFDEEDALLADEPRRAGLRTILFLLILGAAAGAAGWWLGWI